MMMKKYLMKSVAAVAVITLFTSCNKDIEMISPNDFAQNQYKAAFTNYVGGSIAANQNWGFGDDTRGVTRSMTAPAVLGITKPYDEAWVADYLTTAKEPNNTNISHNANNSYVASCQWYPEGNGKLATLWNNFDWCLYEGSPVTQDDKDWYAVNIKHYKDEGVNLYGMSSEVAYEILMKLKEYTGDYTYWGVVVNSEGGFVEDPDWVTNFKITGTWNGAISVAGSEGSQTPGVERTIVLTGTWNITESQRIGSLGKIIIANGGTVNVAQGVMLSMVNQARLVVLPGGKLTGNGSVEVNNGNAAGLENYNGGTVDVATFNNNFGKFFNYGKFLVNEYQGGAQESNFYNHSLAAIDHFGSYDSSTANARIFNACQFYVRHNARIRNYEGVQGSSLIVDGQLMFSSSEDGTNDPTYVGLAAGALVKAGSLYNNGTSWTGPTEGGYAVLSIGQFDYMNWEQDAPQNGGYFANNIYLQADVLNNVPDGNGYHQTDPTDEYNYSLSIAEYKFKNIVANCVGNGNVTVVDKGDIEVIPADDDFEKGVKGCTPGFSVAIPEKEVFNIRIIGEDLSATRRSDFDFNDIVIDVKYDATNAVVMLQAAGGTLKLRFGNGVDKAWEVHEVFGVEQKVMVNTHAEKIPGAAYATKAPVRVELGYGINSAAEAKDKLIIEVFKNNEWCELTAETAEPAAKIAVDTDYQWLDERTSIKDVYPGFVSWVQNPSVANKWWKTVE